MSEKVQVLGPDGPPVDIVESGGSARALVWPGAGAKLRSMHVISLEPGGRTRRQAHGSEAVYYVVSGDVHIGELLLTEGSMVHVGTGASYVIEAGDGGAELVGGPCPADPALYDADSGERPTGEGLVRAFHRDDEAVRLPMIASDARLIVWLGSGAPNANMNYVSMQPGEENVPHSHRDSEDTIYIVAGRGTVEDVTHGFELEFEAGQAIQVPPGIEHRVKANRGMPVVSVGGPCPTDIHMLKAIGVLPESAAL